MMAYPTPDELLALLPAGGDPLDVNDATEVLERWQDSLEFDPPAEPTTRRDRLIVARAEEVLWEGPLAELEVRRRREVGQTIDRELYGRLSDARSLREDYNSLETTPESEPQTPPAYLMRGLM